MLALDDLLFAATEYDDTTYDSGETTRPGKGELYSLTDICKQWEFVSPSDPTGPTVKKCFNTGHPLDFVYEVGKGYNMAEYPTDDSLLSKI